MFKEGDKIKIIKDNFSVHGLYEDDLAEVEVDDYLYLIKLDCCKKIDM